MSFAGGAGRKSPFTERAKVTKSHLSPKRSTSSSTSGVGSARSAQQSLFGKESTFGAKDSQFGDSSAKVSQLRNGAQPDVNEPTTPTRASEGSNIKGIRRDDFSSFNSRRVGTPVKTPRTVFGSIPPPSPKRPYMGSPKYQKVLLERPAFYNSPAAGEVSTESVKKEVSISELQKRLKRFLQDENVPCQSQLQVAPSNNLEEIPYNVSRSPRVNPLFRHEDTVLQVAKGGVAFTVGESDANCTHGPALSEEKEVSAALQRALSPEVEQLLPRSLSEDEPDSNNISNETSESSETEQSLRPEDFPVHSEGDSGSQVEEVGDELRDEVVVPEANNLKDLPAQLEQQCIATSMSGIVKVQEWPIEDAIPLPNSSAVEILEEKLQEEVNVEVENSTVGAAQEEVNVEVKNSTVGAAQEEVNVEVEKSKVGASQEYQHEATADCSSEEEVEEEIEILESWSRRFLRFVVLAVMVACMMGFMVLSSGSQGLLPKSLHPKPVAGPLSSSFFTPSVIPIAVGFMGLGKEHEGMPCLPSVHLELKFLSSTSKSDTSQRESSSSSYTSGSYEPISVARKDSKLVAIDNVMDLDQLKTATDYYKELQGKLLFDVASLTSDGVLSDSFEAAITKDGQLNVVVSEIKEIEDVSEIKEIGELEEVMASEDVSQVVAIEEVKLSEDVSETAAMEDISELVDEIAEELRLKILLPLDESGCENLENLQINRDAIADPETDKLAAEIELIAFNLVSDVPNEGLHVVPIREFVSLEATNILSSDSVDSVTDSQLDEVNSSVIEEFSIKELASEDSLSISDEVAGLLNVPPVTEEISIPEYPIASPVHGTDEDSSSGSSDNVDDLVDYYEEELVNAHHDEPRLQSTTDAFNSNEENVQPLSEPTCRTEIPVSNVVDDEEPVAEGSMETIGLLVVAFALAVPFLLKFRKSPTISQADEVATEGDLFPGPIAALKSMDSPPGWPTTQSVFDSHVPDRDELDAITSPLKSNRAPRKYGIESYSTRFGSAAPAMSAPGVFKSPARVVQKPATTWHPAMKAGGSTISSSYRQTASYVPTIPSESGISFSTRDTMDSVCESALTMGAEEWEHLGSYTATEIISAVTEGGEEHKVRTPVRRSQRIRNRVSPLPAKFDECYL